jgi:hypothetical protein
MGKKKPGIKPGVPRPTQPTDSISRAVTAIVCGTMANGQDCRIPYRLGGLKQGQALGLVIAGQKIALPRHAGSARINCCVQSVWDGPPR